MKFRNKETGEVYDISKGNYDSGFCNGCGCVMCPIYPIGAPRCTKWVNEHPNKAAELMGYELVEETVKPRICEVLGVEVGQRFKIKGAQLGFYVDAEGMVRREEDDICTGLPEICFMINKPDEIEKNKIWTDQEVQDALAVKKILNVDIVHRSEFGGGLSASKSDGSVSIMINQDLFPSLLPGCTAELSDIIGGAE